MRTPRQLPIALAALALLNLRSPASAEQGMPGGGAVVSGSATIGSPASDQLTVRQNSQRAIIDWRSFSIGEGQSVRFVQPGTAAAVLNRVTGSTPSTIAGTLSGNGQVFLVNPNGIAIMPTGTVQLGGGFVASTLDIRDADFMAGRLEFSARDGAIGRLANAGTVQVAPGGFVALLGDQVSNEGRISAPLGRVALGAGTQATLDLNGDGFLQIGWTGDSRAADSGVDVSGSVKAVGGRIELKAADARAALRSVVNVSGSLVATSVSGRDGAIVLEAGADGSAQVSGLLDVSGQASAGRIAISGNSVALDGDAARLDARSADGHGGAVSATAHDALTLDRVVIDASGASGGGSVLLGGDLRGGGTLAHSRTTAVQDGALIRADALVQGTGGKIVLWSDEHTAFQGRLSARGAGAGAGGIAEVSSQGVLGFGGSVDLRGASGRSGELLLDPYNITISTGTDNNHDASFTATGNSSVIKTTTLQAALASANVTVSTGSSGTQSGDITLASALTWASGTTLTLSAARDVIFNATVTATNGGGLTATAGRTVSVNSNLTGSGSAFNVSLQASASSSGSVNLNGSTVSTNGGTFTASAAQSTTSATAVSISNSTIDTGGGALTISAQHTKAGVSGNNSKAISLSNASLQIGNGTASLTGAVTLSGAGNFADGIYATNSLTLGGTGTFSLTGSAAASASSTTAIGIEFYNGSLTVGASSTTLTGSGVRGFVSDLHRTITVNGGSLNVVGTATNDSGVQFKSDNALVNNGGTLNFSGTSALYRGLDLISGATLNVTGTATLSGTNICASGCRDTAGVHLADGITLNSGNLSISGSAVIGPGVRWVNGNTASASFSNLGAGLLGITGSSNSGIGFEFARTNSGKTAGAVTFSGSSTSGSGLSLQAGAALTQSSGNLALSGASTTGLGVDQASGSTLTNAGAGTLALQAGSQGMTLAGSVSSSGGGALSLTGAGAIGQGSTGTIGASALLLGGATANYDLSAAGNQIGTVAGTAASLSLRSTSSLTVGAVQGTSSLTTSGAVTLRSGGDVTLASGASVQGSSPVIDAAGRFVNQSGSSALIATSGRWLIYSADASGNTFGSLDSGNTALWNATYASLAPASVTASGSRYVFAHQPTLTFSSVATSKVYGDDASASLAARYTVSGYVAGVAQAYLTDSASTAFSGAPALSSTGSAATATVTGGPYAISIAQGTLTSTAGYALVFGNSGSLSVTPRALTVQANNGTHVYGNALPFSGTEFSTTG
ncbi:filamentous hemagglutinin N-terminal domain-containing protein, partial [Rhizobacter sp. Root1221]|uniref:beta strand repeat-containing protein n=1 Tax=Rhizobacter sp. Root1221 TaxID=1736433 RepID=UPI001F16BE9B